MAFDRKPGGFGGNRGSGGFRSGGGRPPFGKPGFGGKSFGGPHRDDSRPTKMYPATCADCGVATEVPFRPDGSRPIYCKDCLAKREPLRRDVGPRRDFGAGRGDAPRFERRDRDAAPRAALPDTRIDQLMREVAGLGHKLDGLSKMVEQMTAAPAAIAPKQVVKEAAKKAAKKTAPKPAKKAAKKAVKK
ncbi:hypothetical protein FJY94_02110 [Candidatus Kaiserbacteria bacterium]|nr:hypothetical protein [Candidatus Kaiserbacteria bacterium]